MWSVGVLAYVMLTGISPFHGDSDEETLKNVTDVKYGFDPKHFQNVSSEAKDFISKLLNGDQKKRLTVQQALSHPWMQLADSKKDHGELLTTQFLKEFKYRHKWVERRVFVQYGPDDEETSPYKVDLKGIRSALELLEPTYFPPLAGLAIDSRRPVTIIEPPPVAATFKLPSSTRTPGRDSGTSAPSDRQSRKAGYGDSADTADSAGRRDQLLNGSSADHLNQNGYGHPAEGDRRKKESADSQGQKGHKPDSRSGTDKASRTEGLTDEQQLLSPQELSALLSAERRAIEEELANRILSDISEEGSVASEAGSNPPSRKSSMAKQQDDKERTPTQDDYSILMRPNRPLRLEIDDIANSDGQVSPRRKGKGSKGLKSPVRQSPTKEQVMECIVSSAKALLSPNKSGEPADDLSPKIRAAKREAEMARKKDDDDFDALMNDVDRMKKDFRRRLSEIRDGYDKKPRADMENGYDKSRGPGPPIVVPQYPYPGYEVEDYEWDTDYQMGPETFLLQQRNADLAGRIRDYRRHLFGDSASYVEKGYLGAINRDVAVRERRRYTDLIRDDKDLAKTVNVLEKDMNHIHTGAVKRVRMTPAMAAPLPGPGGVCPPVFQHRIKDTVFAEDSQVTFQCVVVGTPEPTVCWFHNEALVVEGPRHKTTLEHCKATLTIKSAQLTDVGVYKCVADNEHGQSVCVARLKQGDLPTRPSRPDVILASDTEVFITWEQPPLTSGLGILCYKLEFRKCGEDEWSCPWFVISDSLDEESVVVKRLEFLGIYQFRVVAKNAFGWGEPSLASRIIQTHVKGAPKLNIELLRKDYHLNVVNLPHHVSLLSEIPEEEGVVSESTPSENREEQPKKPSLDLNTTENPKNRYQLDSEIFRGRFCLVRNAMDTKNDTNAHCAAKICMASPDHKEQAMNEYETLREIQHENVVHLMSAYFKEDFLVLFMEKLHDDLLDRFTYQDYYTEDHVARVIAQILSALQWIHFKRICLMDLQPDNIMFPSKRIWSVKICDTGSAIRMVEGEQTKAVPSVPIEFSAPEVLQTGTASPMTDIWGVGLLGFLLLSGVNPYVLDDDSSEADIVKCITMEKCDINYVYTNASQEALKFVTWCLKKQPSNRMTTEDGLQHKWLSVLDVMIRRRETIKFSANRLRTFTRKYREKRRAQATDNNQLLTEYGSPPSR